MRNLGMILIITLLTGCASLKTKVQEYIQEGSSSQRVIDVLGQPDRFEPSSVVPGATAWYYGDMADICGFTIQNHKVVRMGCYPDPRWANAVQAAQTYQQNYNARQVSCVTNGDVTNCQ